MSALLFKALSETARMPRRAHAGDGGLDLYSDQEALIQAGDREIIGTGVAVAIPHGKGGMVIPRSGLAAKNGIGVVNSPGLIDAGYRGEIRVVLLNTSRDPFVVGLGDRVAQLVLVDVGLEVPEFVDELPDTGDGRGVGGFGSSGRA